MEQIKEITKKLAPEDQENIKAFHAAYLEYHAIKGERTLKTKFFKNTALYIVGSCLKSKEYNDIDLALVGLTKWKYWNTGYIGILSNLGDHLKDKLKEKLNCDDDFSDWDVPAKYSADCWDFMILSQTFHPKDNYAKPLHFSVLTNNKNIKQWEKYQQEKGLPYMLLWKPGMTNQDILTKNLKVNKT